MKILSTLAACGLAAGISAQSVTLPVAPVGDGFTYGNPGANSIDITVLNPNGITIQALTVSTQNPVGTPGALQIWVTDAANGITTHVGNEQNQANWIQITEGDYISAGFGPSGTSCQSAFTVNVPDTFLAPGTYGFMIVYVDVNHLFTGVPTGTAYPQVFANTDVSFTNGTTQSAPWTAAPLNTFSFTNQTGQTTNYIGTIPDFELTYAPGNVAHACASCSNFGEGSNRSSASSYQLFAEPNASADASAALTGQTMSFIPNGLGTGYIQTAVASTAGYVAPTGAATPLPLADDQETQILTTIPVQYASDTGLQLTQDLFIHSNGYVSLGMAQSALGFAPIDPNAAVDADATCFYSWHDFNNTEPGSGQIVWEEDLGVGKLYVTWDGVESYPTTASNPSTLQFQFDYNTGQVDIIWVNIDATGGSTFFGGDNTLIGWSGAGDSPTTDPFDITTLAASPLTLEFPEVFPFQLESSAQPLIGNAIDLVTSNEPTQSVGVNLLGESSALLPAPFDLSVLGGPVGAVTYLDPTTSILNTISNIPGAGSMTLTLPIAPIPALAGLEVVSQSFWLDFTGANFPFTGIISSNAVSCVLGNF